MKTIPGTVASGRICDCVDCLEADDYERENNKRTNRLIDAESVRASLTYDSTAEPNNEHMRNLRRAERIVKGVV